MNGLTFLKLDQYTSCVSIPITGLSLQMITFVTKLKIKVRKSGKYIFWFRDQCMDYIKILNVQINDKFKIFLKLVLCVLV